MLAIGQRRLPVGRPDKGASLSNDLGQSAEEPAEGRDDAPAGGEGSPDA